MRKVLWIILGIVVVAFLVTFVWWLSKRIATNKEQTGLRNINVAALANADEKTLGTIIYTGAKKDGAVTIDNKASTVNLTTTDSVDGAFNIYYQDILNRYKTYSVSKSTISKSDALGGKARVITCSGQTGKITVTIWGDNKGITHIQIVTTTDFK